MANKDIGSIYTNLLSKPETIDLGKRLLLDQCFFKETNQRVQTMERAQGILAKIEEKATDKKGWYAGGRMWLNDEDWRLIADCVKVFNERHMIFLNQSLVFEKLVDGKSREGLAVMEFHIRKHIETFRSDQLTVNNKSPHKLMYDSVRIFGLRIAA